MTRQVLARTAAVFAAVLAAGALVVGQQARLERAERRRAASEAARSAADAIAQQLEGSLAAPYALAAAVRHAGDVHDFERFAGELLGVFGGIDSLQLAPGGVLRHIQPLAGNEKALGLDLLNDPVHRPDALRAIATRRLVLAGPFRLRQGGVGLAARVPVFVVGEDGTERFWGLASAILGVPRLLGAAGLGRLADAGYEYELRTSSGGERVAASDGAASIRDPVTAQIKLPSGAWSLSVAPRRGWSRGLFFGYAMAAAIAAVIAWLAWRVFRLPERLAVLVAERTTALRRAASEREAILEGISDPAWMKDTAGHLVALNDAYAKLAGRPQAALLGLTHAEIFGPAHADEVERHDAQVVATGAELIAEETVTADGVTSTYEVVKRPLRDAGGAVVGTVGIARDITERRKLEARVRQAEKMEAVGRLAGGIAHDFNNILTVVLGSATELRELAPDPQIRELADEVIEGGERAAVLTRQLLAFSRQQPIRPCDVDLNEVVRGLDRMLRRVIPENVAMEIQLHEVPVVVRADRGQLEQVLLNLVVNARDAMPAGGLVAIRTRTAERAPPECAVEPGPCAVLEVQDSGTGIDEAVRPHLFEPFFTTKRNGKGTGLGLATVFGIVKQGGGGIAVETAPSAGTSFRVYLPRSDAAPPARESADAQRDAGGAPGNAAVLVVEDDPAVRGVIRRSLDGAGYAVLEAAGADEALALAAQADGLDLLVTDMVMPGRNGKELAAKLLARWPALRVVFVSGYTEDVAIRSGVLPPGQVFVPKPFTGDRILAAVRASLDGRVP